ncbi:hypothetical protein SY88_03660 [Clostridiales bacterium PH28_bin88]|nr:hypothetical protein SY88_03660 [Clostridiales bacterium PH28_bin88]
MEWERLAEHLKKQITGEVKVQEPLKNYTSWRIGGPADLLVVPGTLEDLRVCLSFARDHGVPLTVLGNGSNVLVLDGGIRGLVVKTAGGLSGIRVQGERVTAEAGAMLPVLVNTVIRYGLTGLEFAAGIPGTVGGAVVMNAGAEGQSISEVVEEVTVLRTDGEFVSLGKKDLTFGYRHSSLQEHPVTVAAVVMGLRPGNIQEITDRVRRLLEVRRKRQPLNRPNAGSVFTNPGPQAAGYLIEKVGAKGLTRGRAQVSSVHANFIVNMGGATAADVLDLIEEVRERVRREFGISLKTEIKVLGEGLSTGS